MVTLEDNNKYLHSLFPLTHCLVGRNNDALL